MMKDRKFDYSCKKQKKKVNMEKCPLCFLEIKTTVYCCTKAFEYTQCRGRILNLAVSHAYTHCFTDYVKSHRQHHVKINLNFEILHQ